MVTKGSLNRPANVGFEHLPDSVLCGFDVVPGCCILGSMGQPDHQCTESKPEGSSERFLLGGQGLEGRQGKVERRVTTVVAEQRVRLDDAYRQPVWCGRRVATAYARGAVSIGASRISCICTTSKPDSVLWGYSATYCLTQGEVR